MLKSPSANIGFMLANPDQLRQKIRFVGILGGPIDPHKCPNKTTAITTDVVDSDK
jgi:hypothetical protein